MSDVTTITELRLETTAATATYFYALADEANGPGTARQGLLLDASYQRQSVWSLEQRRALMLSFLTNLPVPAVVVNDRFGARFETTDGIPDWRTAVVDGKQRIETLLAWRAGTLTLPRTWFRSEHLESDSEFVSRNELTRTAQRHVISRTAVPLATAKVTTVAAEAEIYLLLNCGGTAHTEDELERARRIAS